MSNRPLTIFLSFPTNPLTDFLPNGDGLVAHGIIKSLVAQGHELHIVTTCLALRNPLPSGVNIYPMLPSAQGGQPGKIAYMIWSRRVLNRLRQHLKFDLIHELNPVFSLLSLAFLGSGIPVVLGPHSSRWPADLEGPESTHKTVLQWITKRVKNSCVYLQHRVAAAILLSTPAALNNVTQPERLIGRLFLLPPGVDDHQFSPESDITLFAAAPTVLFLANMVKRKGILTLLNAFDVVSERLPDASLLLGGDGPMLDSVREIVKSSKYFNRVQLLGRVSRSEITGIMRKSTVYCLPSHGEPFGMSALEAMACGLPLVVTDSGGLAYLVSDEGGKKVPVNDPDSLAVALFELLQDRTLCRAMGEFNRKQVERQYSYKSVADRLGKIYEHVLNKTGHASQSFISQADIVEYESRSARRHLDRHVARSQEIITRIEL